MNKTIFQKIIDREIPSTILYEDDEIIAIEDINPVAPVHDLIIPKKCIETLNDLNETDGNIVGKMVLVAKNLAKYSGFISLVFTFKYLKIDLISELAINR